MFASSKFYAPSIVTNTYDNLLKDETNNMTTKTHKPLAVKTKPPAKSERVKKDALAKQQAKSQSINYAKVSLQASTMSAVLSEAFTSQLFPDVKLADSISALSDKIATIQNGDMQPIEAMLTGQAQALQTMFVSLGRQAVTKTGLQQYTAFMNLALKAQAQSRATIQALIELKYPKQATFVKQANISNGNQQVNNGQTNNATSTRAPAHAQVIEQTHNELLNDLNKSEGSYATVDNARTTKTS